MDFCAHVRRDHDDLDLALVAMVDTRSSASELHELLDGFRLGLAIHLAAEARALATLTRLETRPRDALRSIVAQLRTEHAVQDALARELTQVEPGSDAWHDVALRLRIELLDHASREDYVRTPLETHVSATERQLLASRLAAERVRILCTMRRPLAA